MTDFSFYNKAYDLLLGLKEDGIIHNEPFEASTVGELRLMIDLVKEMYPLFANADNKTIASFIRNSFGERPTEIQIEVANHDDVYRLPKIWEILPGKTFRIEGSHDGGKPYYYTHVFAKGECSNEEYSRRFMFIWDRVKEGKVLIKNDYAHRIGDKIYHKDDPDSRGTIKDRLPAGEPMPMSRPDEFKENAYSVYWENTGTKGEVPLTYWFDESDLINQSKLEAMPMKTEEIILITKTHKVLAMASYEEYDDDLVKDLMNQFGFTREQIDKQIPNSGWVYKERNFLIGKHSNIVGTIKQYLSKEKVRYIKILRTKCIGKSPNTYKPKIKRIHKEIKKRHSTKCTPRPEKYIEQVYFPEREKIVRKFIIVDGKVVEKTGLIQEIKIIKAHVGTTTQKLVCVKHITTGVVSRIRTNEAIKLVGKKDDYDYASKLEYRTYLNEQKRNRDEKKPGPTIMGKEPVTGMKMNRRGRRYDKQKYRKGSRLVKEQSVIKIVPEEVVERVSQSNTLNEYDKDGNFVKKVQFYVKYTKAAHTILQRILTRVQPHKEIKITDDILLQRKEQSAKDRNKYLTTKNLKPLSDLVEEFRGEERRNEKFSLNEKWSRSFGAIYKTVTSGLAKIGKDTIRQVGWKARDIIVNDIIKEEHSLKWSKEKISDFVRYLRLTTHGIFGVKKEKPPKKKVLSKEFEGSKFITRVDHSKFKYNMPDVDKPLVIKFNDANGELEADATFKENDMYNLHGDFLCPFRDVAVWKYAGDDEFKEALIVEEGAFTRVPIKFRWKPNESLQKFFDKQKEKKAVKAAKEKELNELPF